MAFLVRCALILIVMAASVALAPSRGHMTGAFQITICSENGTETLTLDARGNPVAPHAPCPECVLCLTTVPLIATGGLSDVHVAASLSYPVLRRLVVSGNTAIHPTARGPPLSA